MGSELAQHILNLKDGDHLCLFYDRMASTGQAFFRKEIASG